MMATGYIHPVADGEITDLKTFALRCSYAMMALVTLRDDDHRKDPPRELPLDLTCYEEKLVEAQKRLDDIAMMTDAQRDAMVEEEYQRDLAGAREFDAEEAVERERVKAMRAKVEAWQDAPEGLKTFMLGQFERTLADDSDPYSAVSYVRRRDIDAEWRKAVEAVGQAHADIDREKALHKSRSAWLAQLWAAVDALPSEEGTEDK
jgi:hypothetical protein